MSVGHCAVTTHRWCRQSYQPYRHRLDFCVHAGYTFARSHNQGLPTLATSVLISHDLNGLRGPAICSTDEDQGQHKPEAAIGDDGSKERQLLDRAQRQVFVCLYVEAYLKIRETLHTFYFPYESFRELSNHLSTECCHAF